MWLFKQPMTTTRTALTYITLGALTAVWAGVWYVYLFNNPPESHSAYYWCTGFMVTALALVVIGVGLGLISRSNQPAGLPPEGVAYSVVKRQPEVSAPLPILGVNSNGPLLVPDGNVVVAPPQRG
jgi:hypothetical protein